MNKLKNYLVTLVCLCLVLLYCVINDPERDITLTLGVFAGSSWDEPTGTTYQIIDQAIEIFEKQYPNVTIEYKSGIVKADYSSWLSTKITNGDAPDLFMVLPQDFNTLASIEALKNLNSFIKEDELDTSVVYDGALDAGNYNNNQYAFPYEINPTLMCINHDLLTQEGISIPDNNWTIEDFYNICNQVTKDTDGDGIVDQFGCYGMTWQDAINSYGLDLFNDNKCNLDNDDVKEALSYVTKIKELFKGYNVSSDDFDKGNVAFCPLSLAQYRTYQPYPYRISKYSSFQWTCISMPGTKNNQKTTHLDTSLISLSSQTSHSKVAWEFLKTLTMEQSIQQQLFNSSQGASPLKGVMLSDETKDILAQDVLSNSTINQNLLNEILTNTIALPKFKEYETMLNKADYLITKALDEGNLDNKLNEMQKELEFED